MTTRGNVRRRRYQHTIRSVKPRLHLEWLEDRTLLSDGNWLVHLNGLPGDTRAVQMAAAQILFHNAGLDHAPVPIRIVDHVGADGILWIHTPAKADQRSVQRELQALRGFDYVEGYNPDGPNPDLRSWFQAFETPEPIDGPPPGGGAPFSPPPSLNPNVGFDGINSNQSFCGCQPPDTIGAAGPSSYIETVNTSLAIYNKSTGAALVGPTSFGSFFSSLGGELSFSDPVVTYDEIHQRFVIAILDFNTSSQSRLDVAISKSNNPATLTSADWDMYRYNVNDRVGASFDFADYPKLGYNADGYVFSFNMFPNLRFFDHVTTLAVRYSDRAGFLNVVPGGFNRFTFAPATMHGSSAGDPMWFVEDGHEGGSGSNVTVVQETSVFSSAPSYTFTTLSELSSLGSYSAPPRAPQQGSTQTIDTMDGRFYFSALRTVAGTTHLVAAHTVGTAGVARVRWYDFNVGGASPSLIQEGEINQGAGVYTFLPSLDINANGSIGMTFGQSASDQYWSMYVTGRSDADPLGTLQTPVLAGAGTVSSSDSRAGDYSFVNVDPSNNTTFWAANEYAGSAAFWTTWIQSFDVSSQAAGPYVTSQSPSGTVLPAVHDLTVTFNAPVHVSGAGGFDTSKISNYSGPASFSVDTVTPLDQSGGLATRFDLHFAGAGLTTAGNYSFHIGPNITDASGNPMDQNQNGTAGEPNDYYLAALTIGRPAIVSSSPTGTNVPVVPKVHVIFNEPMLVSSFSTTKITAFTRNGVSILGDIASVVATNQVGSTATEFDINFATGLEAATGVYSMTIGPNITDQFGNAMAAAYMTRFNIDGPQVTDITPSGPVSAPVTSETVTFSRAMQVSTFTTDEVTLTDPNGNPILVVVTPINPVGGAATQFLLVFDPQTTPGDYTTIIGPDIQDTFGNAMDQNGNFIPGEPGVAPDGDQFQSIFTITDGPSQARSASGGARMGDSRGPTTVAAAQGSLFAGRLGGFASADDGLSPALVRALSGQPAGSGNLLSASAGQGAPTQGVQSGANVTALDQLFASRQIPWTFSSSSGEHRPASDAGDEFSLPGLTM